MDHEQGPPLATAVRFFEKILGREFSGLLVIWTKQDRRSRFFRAEELDEAAGYALDRAETMDVYFGLGLLDEEPESGRGKLSDVTAISFLWMDLDFGIENHKGENYPPTQEEAMAVVEKFPYKPLFIISSGNGLHCYWPFRDIWEFETAEERDEAARLSRQFQKKFADIAKDMGYKVDTTSDLTRILRVPGTFNRKGDEPKPVLILEDHADDESYFHDPQDFWQYLEELPEFKQSQTLPVDHKGDYLPARLEAVLAPSGCAWMRHCRKDANVLAEPEWYGMLTVVARCEDAAKWAHQLSEAYPGYDPEEASRKLGHATGDSPGPITCGYIRENFGSHCEGCAHKVTSPVLLGRNKRLLREARMPSTIDQMLYEVESGSKTAHLREDSIEALALMKQKSLVKYHEIREYLKEMKCPVADLEPAVIKEIKRQEKEVESQEDGTDRPLQEIYDQWIEALKDTGYLLDSSGNLCFLDDEGVRVVIANFVARISKEILLDDGTYKEKHFLIDGVLAGGESLPPLSVPANEFNSMRWILSGWGAKATLMAGSYKRERVRECVQLLGREAPLETVYGHIGWHEADGQWFYLHAGGCIGAEGKSVMLDGFAKSFDLPEDVLEPAEAMGQSMALLDVAPREVTVPLFALIYLAPLCEAARRAKHEPQFVLWLHGITGAKKTTLAMLFLHHFGTFTSPTGSFKDTANNLEKKGFTVKDAVLLVDDYHPSASKQEAKKMETTAQYLLRFYGDRIGKGRLTASTEFRREYQPRGMALVTGEDVVKGESSMARFLAVELKKGEVDTAKLTEAQRRAQLLSQAMRGYIEWLVPQMESLHETLKDFFQEVRESVHQKDQHGRLAETVAWLYIGFAYAVSYANGLGVISDEEMEALLQEASSILTDLAYQQSLAVNDEKPAQKFLETLKELFSAGIVRTAPYGQKAKGIPSGRGTFIGWHDDNFLYLLPDIIYNEVNRFYNGRGEAFPVNPKTLWKRLDEAGFIRSETEKKPDGTNRKQHLPKITVALNKRDRVLHLRKEALGLEDWPEQPASPSLDL